MLENFSLFTSAQYFLKGPKQLVASLPRYAKPMQYIGLLKYSQTHIDICQAISSALHFLKAHYTARCFFIYKTDIILHFKLSLHPPHTLKKHLNSY